MGIFNGVCPACKQEVWWQKGDVIMDHAGRTNMSGYTRKPLCPASGLTFEEAAERLTPPGPTK